MDIPECWETKYIDSIKLLHVFNMGNIILSTGDSRIHHLMGLFSAAANGCVGSVRKGKKWRCHEHNIFINTFIFYKAHTYQRQSIQN